MRAQDGAATFAAPLERVLVDQNFNVRIFYGDIDGLAIRLMTEGQLEPIKVRKDGDHFFVVDGHRRHRAFNRARALSIQPQEGRFLVCEGGRTVAEAPGPVNPRFDADSIWCRLIDPASAEEEVFASQMIYNSGKPFTLLERMIFLSRLCRLGGMTREQLALQTGFSRTYVANAQHLHAADPRLLEYVREGKISQKLALRLLRAFSADQQISRVCEASAEAQRRQRDKILPKDIRWVEVERPRRAGLNGANGTHGEGEGTPTVLRDPIDPVRGRMQAVARRLAGAERYAANPAARDRLGTLALVHRYAFGKLSYAQLEAHVMGRE